MDNKTYLDFDEAVHFLKTTPSTLYKWLQAGKVPGHKLGRQWRFLKEELELHVSGKGPQIQSQKEILALTNFLLQRSKKENSMDSPTTLAEQLIWDAYDHGSRTIHIGPAKGHYEIRYRQRKGLEKLTEIHEETFNSIDEYWQKISSPLQSEKNRRIYLNRSAEEGLQIRYNRLETVSGPRVTLRLFNPEQDVMPLEKICSGDDSVLATFRNWAQKSFGLIVLSGSPGSGKTTTFYSMLHEIRKQGSNIITLERPVDLVIDGINQVELSEESPHEIRHQMNAILSSDPDVIGLLGLNSSQPELEKILIQSAVSMASTGHLVLLQLHTASCQEAFNMVQDFVDLDIEKILVGISSQKLVPSPKGLRAEYQFFESKK